MPIFIYFTVQNTLATVDTASMREKLKLGPLLFYINFLIITRIFYFINNLITVLRWKNLRFSELGVIHSLRGQTIVTFVLSLEIPHYFQVFIGKSQDPDYKAFSSQVRRSSSFFILSSLFICLGDKQLIHKTSFMNPSDMFHHMTSGAILVITFITQNLFSWI